MTKKDLAYKVSLRTDVNQDTVEKVINQTMDEIKAALATRQPIYLRGFGTWEPKVRRLKTARNISTGARVIIPEHRTPVFKPCKEFKQLVAGM